MTKVEQLAADIEALNDILERHTASCPWSGGGAPHPGVASAPALRRAEEWIEEDQALRLLLGRRLVTQREWEKNPPREGW